MATNLTGKRRKFADAYLDAFKGDTKKADAIKAACLVAGYSSSTQGYRALKNEAVISYMDARKAGAPSRKVDTPPPVDPDIETDEEIVALRQMLSDEDNPTGARVRAAELLMKQKGIEKPTGEEVVEDPEAALDALLIMLGVEEVTPADFHRGQHKTWTVAVLP